MLSRSTALAMILLLAGCTAKKPESPSPRYADARSCAGCHAAIAAKYKNSGMARAFAPAGADTIPAADAYYHAASESYFTMASREGKFFQSRHQKGPRGERINEIEKEIHFVMGSGNHAKTFLHRAADGKLIQLPLGWYSDGGGRYAMNPGYDRRDHAGFRRAIPDDCMFCHNAYPAVTHASRAHGGDAVFPAAMPAGIDCQRCHGPGQAHVDAAASGKPAAALILNPKGRMEVCMQCHLESTSRDLPYAIVRFEREPYSHSPAEPLDSYVLHFDFAKPPEDHFEIAHAAYRLRKSACFLKSGGKMSCTTCHDPHDTKRDAAQCAQCHAKVHDGKQSGDRTRIASGAAETCISCHMPKRRTDDVVHVVMTDHFIRRTQPRAALTAPLAERHDAPYRGEVKPYLGNDSLYTAVAQVYAGVNLRAGAQRLESALLEKKPSHPEYYHQLAEAHYRQGNDETAVKWFYAALEKDPAYLPSIRNLGTTLTQIGRHADAAAVLRRAQNDAAALTNLGEALIGSGDNTAAAEALRRAVALDGDSPEAWNHLGRATGSEEAFRTAIRIKPDYAIAHANLANRLHARGDWPGAQRHFTEALKDAESALARFNYGTALAERGALAEAEKMFRDAIRLDARMPDAYLNLGNLQIMQGRAGVAIPQFESALRVSPSMGRARLGLAIAYAESGRLREAAKEFRAAAQDRDPEIRRAASDALTRLPGQF